MRRIISALLVIILIFVLLMGSFALSNDSNNTDDSNFDNRQKYQILLEGKYYAGELVQKFHELFGDQYTPEYIRENYTELFGVPEGKIDEGILQILTWDAESEIDEDYLDSFLQPPVLLEYSVPEEAPMPVSEVILNNSESK